MKNMKKWVCLALIVMMALAIALPALAGTVHGGRLNLRKNPYPTATIIGYIPNGSYVETPNGYIKYGSNPDYYYINAPSYLSGQSAADCVWRLGYGQIDYIWQD